MATLKIFTIRDSKAEAYLNPFFMQSAGMAIRAFQTCANDPQHDFNKYSGDFSLFEIGEYTEETGHIKMHESKINLGLALEHIIQKTYPNSTAHIQNLEN